MARGGHGLPKVSTGSTMPDPSTPCGQATPETASQLQGWPTHKAGGLEPSSTILDPPTLYAYKGGGNHKRTGENGGKIGWWIP
jgi:hypothetical protein